MSLLMEDKRRSSRIQRDTLRVNMYSGRRSSGMGGNVKAVQLFQPTYRLESQKPFEKERTENILKMVMLRYLDNFHYCPLEALDVARRMAGEVKLLIKGRNYDRYRIVVSILIGENAMQGSICTAKGLWDVDVDKYVSHYMKANDWFALGSVWAFYIN